MNHYAEFSFISLTCFLIFKNIFIKFINHYSMIFNNLIFSKLRNDLSMLNSKSFLNTL